ncbi:hypothetical protein CDV31_013711 [Fusarium ambrosium]|uniref:Uncharacterized protein n=1 Tax=Fusarium ambrosium TaxID=131363 RepID=A0A428T1P9_9HYPO|nr:hypothetical protein CDV31_013711 [Fusarium ambrosium]
MSVSCVRRFKKRHPELHFKSPKVQEATLVAAETDIQHIDNCFKEFDALMNTMGIQKCDVCSFDQTPLQIGWNNVFQKLCDDGWLRLRGGVAVKAKREKVAAMASQAADRRGITSGTEKKSLENRRRLWIGADEGRWDFQHRIWGRHVLEAIPETADYLAGLDKAAALRGQLDGITEDVLSR